MNSSEQVDLQRSAHRAVRVTEVLIALVTLIIIGSALWGLLDPTALVTFLIEQGLRADPGVATWQALLLDLLLITQMALWCAALLALRALFRGMARQPPFPPDAADAAGRARRWIMWAFVASLLSQPIGSVLGTLHMPDGERMISIEFGTAHALTLIALILTAIMAHALRLAAALWQDHQEIV